MADYVLHAFLGAGENECYFGLVEGDALEKVVEDFDTAMVGREEEMCVVHKEDAAIVLEVFDVVLDTGNAPIGEVDSICGLDG